MFACEVEKVSTLVVVAADVPALVLVVAAVGDRWHQT